MFSLFKDRIFLRNLGWLAIPIIINEMLNSLINMMDTFMTGKLGAASVTAIGLGNQVFFLFSLIIFGICSGASIFMGQYWGNNDIKSVHKVMGIAYLMVILDSAIFFVGALFFPEIIMGIYSKDPEVIRLGAGYLRVVGFSYVLTGLIVVNNAALKATRCAMQPMITTFISLIVNIICNSIFIFVMKMGVVGAAFGTLCARTIELITQIVIIKARNNAVLTDVGDYFKLDKAFLKNYFIITTPVLLNEFMWALGTTVYNIAYKYAGTISQAAVQVANVVQNLFVVFGMGVGASCGILISNALGARDKDKAIDYAKKCTYLAILCSVFLGAVLFTISPFVVNLFDIENEGKHYAELMLWVVSMGMLFKTINYINIVGILRNGGDTIFCFICDTASVWLVGVPMAFLGAKYLGLPIYVVYAMVYSEEVFKTIVSQTRVIRKTWLKTVI